MACVQFGSAIVCGSFDGDGPLVRIRIMHCPTCKRRGQFTQRYGGAYYDDHLRCLRCGDSWASSGEMFERPFQRGWRKESIAKGQAEKRAAVDAATYRERVMADIEDEIAWRGEYDEVSS